MRRRIWLLVGLLVTLSLSCSLFGGGNTPEGTDVPGTPTSVAGGPEEEDESAPVEEESPEASEDALSLDEDSLDQLSSYRALMSWNVEKEDGTVESFSVEQAATQEPAAKHMTMVSEGEAVEIIQIGNDTWMRFGDEWIRSSSDEASVDDFGDALQTSDGWVAGLNDDEYDYLGKETVNGVQTRHYRAERSDQWGAFFGMLGADGEAESGVADVWVADEPELPRFVVRSTIEVQGEIDGVAATMTLSQDVSDINEPFVISPPEDVALGGLPEGVPMYPDATDVTQFGTMTTFTVEADVETVNTFYTDALEAAGWDLDGDPTLTEDTAMSSWAKDEEKLTLMVSSSDGGATTSVVVVLEGGE